MRLSILKEQFGFNNEDFKIHFLVWFLLSLCLVVVDPVEGPLLSQIVGTILIMFSYMFAFYIIRLFIIPKYWKNNYMFLVFFLLIMYLFYVSIDIFNFYFAIPLLGGENFYEDFNIERIFLDDLLTFFFVAVASFTFYFNQMAIEKLKYQNEREKSIIIKELNFLKNQFNSHITFNFLNFCYSQVHFKVPKVADAIELFSGILRYSLSLKPDEKIPLYEEITYIHQYIELQKLLSSKVYVLFEVKGSLDDRFVLPRIFVTFVENAFKHGIFNNQDDPIYIKLEFQEHICFYIKNLKNQHNNVIKTGVGQDNVKQVLDIYYKDQYELQIDDDQEYYSSKLLLKV